jgi:hypothetical protein
VRTIQSVSAITVGKGPRERRVKAGSNHHVEIFEHVDVEGRKKWEGRMVTRYEALRRLAAKEPIVKRDDEKKGQFVFSLAGGEIIELDGENGRQVCVVRSISGDEPGQFDMECVRQWDARKYKDRRAPGEKRIRLRSYKELVGRNCQKVLVTPLGEIRRAK